MNKFEYYLQKTQEYGIVKKVDTSILFCSGLPGASLHELLVFPSGAYGQVLSLDEDEIEVILFSREGVKAGDKVARTGETLKMPVGISLLGKVIDPLSKVIIGDVAEEMDFRDYDSAPRKLGDRRKIVRQLETGVGIIDAMLPLGKGQRELIVGDRKTGKTSVILNIVKRQASLDSVVVYACIGKEKSEIKKLYDFLKEEGVLDKSIIVASFSDDLPSLIDLTPYAAITVSEYFLELGRDVLLVLDDLTTHAKHYREISLLSNRFPGRDSYPGDIFYRHARILERAGNFKINDKEVSLTCLPVAESLDSRLSDYIVSNLISITDGHFLFDVESFNKGRRPAVNVFLSVTRVGKQTQNDIARSLNRKLFRMITSHLNVESYTHFGTELSPEFQRILERGNKIYKFFEQPSSLDIPLEVQTVFLSMIWGGVMDNVPVAKITEYRSNFCDKFNSDPTVREKLGNMMKLESYDQFLEQLKKEIVYFRSLCKI